MSAGAPIPDWARGGVGAEAQRGAKIDPIPLAEVPDDETCVREAKACLLAIVRHGHAVDQVRAATALVEACAKRLPSVKDAGALSNAELEKLAEQANRALERKPSEGLTLPDPFAINAAQARYAQSQGGHQ